MKIRFLHLNIQAGRFINRVAEFIKENDIDVANFQEVEGKNLSEFDVDCFEYLKKSLPDHNGEMNINWNLTSGKNAYSSNATFFKKSFTLLEKDIKWLKEYREIENAKTRGYENDPTSCMKLTLSKDNKKFEILNTHLAWSNNANDDPNKLAQGKKLISYIEKVNGPFILSGDFNVDKNSQTVKSLNKLARNLPIENGVVNTLNLKVHWAKDRIPSPGLGVDFIYVANSLKVNSFRVINEDLSDHLGLFTEIII